MQKVTIKKSKIAGKGLFATKDIRKNEVLFTVKGRIVKEGYGTSASKKFNEPAISEEKFLSIGPNWLAIGKETWIDPYPETPWPYINHACNPNAGLRGKNIVVAMENIKKGEEITIDYSITEDDPEWHMPCRCGAKNCRKMIRSVRFLPKKAFERYAPYMSPFLKKSYLLNTK